MKLFGATYTTSSDEELIEFLKKGKKKAFDEIYNRYAQKLMGYFYKMLWQDREKAEDMVHDIFLKIIQKPEQFDTSRSFRTWLFSVACNMCKNEYKKAEVRKNTKNSIDTNYQLSSSQNVLSEVQDLQFKEAYERAIKELDVKHQEVFTLRYFENLSIKEIAEIVEANEGTIKSRIFYATKQLASKLKEFKNEKIISYE